MKNNVNVQLSIVREGAQIPQYATTGSAAADLHAVLDHAITLSAGQRVTIPTGIAISLPSEEYVALVYARSGLGIKHGISLSNGVGVIDSDYRGEICVGLVNLSENAYTIENGQRIAQMCIMPVCHAAFTVCDTLNETQRGAGGFGSTGL